MVEARRTAAIGDESNSMAELEEKLMADGYADLTDPRGPLNRLQVDDSRAAAAGYVNTDSPVNQGRALQAALSVPAMRGPQHQLIVTSLDSAENNIDGGYVDPNLTPQWVRDEHARHRRLFSEMQ